MKTTISNVYVGAFIKADFLESYKDNKWHKVYGFQIKSDGRIYVAIEGFKGINLQSDYEVEIKE